jgi:integrase
MEHLMPNDSVAAYQRPLLVSARKKLAVSKQVPKYLHRRGTTFYFKRKIPLDVADGFPQFRGQVWKSLGTALFEKARLRLAVEVTEFDLTVAKFRKNTANQQVGEDAMRYPAGEGFIKLPGGPAESCAAQCHRDDEVTGNVVIEKKPVYVLNTFGTELEQPRPVPIKTSVHAHPASPQKGKVLDLLAQPKPMRETSTLLHLLESWAIKQTRRRTINVVRKTVLEFHEFSGSLAAEAITRQHARAYRDSLIEKQLSDVTISNRIGFLSTLFRFGQIELIEHVNANPFERIPVNGGMSLRAEKDRRAYSMAELNTLFASRLYTQNYRPKGQAIDAAYWAPLLGPFVGARIEEIAQLRIEDIERINGVWCIRICNLNEDQNIKNLGSYRRVPLHEIVVKCGFLLYVARQSRAGHERVFPSLSNDNANAVWSNALGKWFGRYLDTLGLSDHRLDYHSFRYTFRQQCSLSGIENEVRDALTGHWITNKDSGRTYMRADERQYPFPKLVTAINQLRYDELRMNHLFAEDPLEGVEQSLLC